jgi:hypothetical protein
MAPDPNDGQATARLAGGFRPAAEPTRLWAKMEAEANRLYLL